MTFTYSTTSSTPTNLSRIRMRLGDTNSSLPIFTDEEITAALTDFATVTGAAYYLCKAAIAKYARDVDRSMPGISSQRSQQVAHLRDVLADLREEMLSGASGFTGGASKAGQDAINADTDFRQPHFQTGMDEHK